MKDLSKQELTLLATIIAIELTKNKCEKDIKQIKALVSQLHSTLSTICILD